jgi:hypothetical protein
VELQQTVRNSAPVSRRIAPGPAIFIGLNAIAHKSVEGEMDPNENDQRLKDVHQTIQDLAQKYKASDTKLINEIAEWMAAEVKRRKKLDHSEAANEIRQRLQNPLDALAIDRLKLIVGTQERNDRDGSIRQVYRLGPPVLRAFRELTRKTVRWGKNDRYWVAVKQKKPPPMADRVSP